jgi:hypothetical protein
MDSDLDKWLPDLIHLPASGLLDEGYLKQVFERYRSDFVENRPNWPEKRFAIKRMPEREGWPATFWHLITEGENEENRQLVGDRCQKIAWPRAIIKKYLEFPARENKYVNFWYNTRRTSSRLLISTMSFNYLVVIEVRDDYVLLWTAYPTLAHTARKLKREYDAYWS